jgi:hypothetical protein
VCGKACRLKRRRKQEKRRRAEDVDGARAEERARQQRHREEARAARDGEVSRASLDTERARKKPDSSDSGDKGPGLSRASLVPETARILAESDEMLGQVRQKIGLSRAGLRHESAAAAVRS